MAITVPDFNALDPSLVEQNLNEIVQRIQEDNPSLDLRRGVLHDLVSYYHAILGTALQDLVNQYLRGRSLLDIENDPELADESLVDGVLSNFRLTRLPGSAASGEVTVVMDSNATVTFAVGARFQANGLIFLTDQVYQAKAESSQVTAPGDRLFRQLDDGNFAFTITVVAEQAGAEYQLPRNTLVIPQNSPVGYVTSFASNDFVEGRNPETNSELIERLQAGVAARAMSNRGNMLALLRETEEFSRILRVSIIGHGDAELTRSRHSLFPISLPGRMDWYVRSEELYLRETLTKTAVLIEKTTENGGVWQFSLGKDDAPGFYEIETIKLPTAENVEGSFEITDDFRGLDLTGVDFVPDLVTADEGAFSPFQTATIRFVDDVTNTIDLALGAQQDYQVATRRVQLLKDLQDFAGGREVRPYGGDIVVKAATPAFLQVSMTIVKRSQDETPDTDAIAQAIAQMVNNIGFTGRLHASQVHDVVHGFLGVEMAIQDTDLFARLRYSNGQIRYLRSREVLVVPDDPDKMVTSRTVQWFLQPEDVAIAVVSTVPDA